MITAPSISICPRLLRIKSNPPNASPTRSLLRIVPWIFASQLADEARHSVLRKLPPTERDQLRLIDIHDFDLTACGGTHVAHTGQIGSVLLRKSEKVRHGYRVEFRRGLARGSRLRRRDFSALTETAGTVLRQYL